MALLHYKTQHEALSICRTEYCVQCKLDEHNYPPIAKTKQDFGLFYEI